MVVVLLISTFLYMQQDMFGKKPTGSRLEKIKQSPNYQDGKFQNLNHTPVLAEGHNYYDVIYENYIKNKPNHYPKEKILLLKQICQIYLLMKMYWFGLAIPPILFKLTKREF